MTLPQSEDDIARASHKLLDLVGETPVHRDDLLRLCGAQTWIGLAALSELEVAGRIIAGESGFYNRS
jgi:DNA processing protein